MWYRHAVPKMRLLTYFNDLPEPRLGSDLPIKYSSLSPYGISPAAPLIRYQPARRALGRNLIRRGRALWPVPTAVSMARLSVSSGQPDCRQNVYFIASPRAASSSTSGSPRTTPIITSLQTLRLSSGTRRKLLVVSGSSRPAPPAQCQRNQFGSVFGSSPATPVLD